jgi:malate synthase
MVINALNSGAKTFMADFEGERALLGHWRVGVVSEWRGR